MKKIAIIGGGISGITAAWQLQNDFDVSLFEAAESLGGHTSTITITSENKPVNVDTGFIVFNEKTYPNFINLLNEWQVAYEKSDMSFSVSSEDGFEYNSGSLKGLFVSKKNIFNPSFWLLLKDIIKFNLSAKKMLKQPEKLAALTMRDVISELNLSQVFCDYYLYPMASAIWSGSLTGIENFSAYFLLNFYNNHGLLNFINRPQWYYIKNGSKSYLERFSTLFSGKIFCNTKVSQVIRESDNVKIKLENQTELNFDAVIFANHADEVLKILVDGKPEEITILEKFPYFNNEIVLHNDAALMPKRKGAWASWNYLLHKSSKIRPTLSYYMNTLQALPTHENIIVTVNPPKPVNSDHVFKKQVFSHPQFSMASFVAQ